MSEIIEQIWSGQVEQREPLQLSEVGQLFVKLAPGSVITLSTKAPSMDTIPTTLYGGEELLPGVTLADVLCEELDIHVEDETIVYLEPSVMDEREMGSAERLCLVVGRLMIGLAKPSRGALLADQLLGGKIASAGSGMKSFPAKSVELTVQ